MSSRSGKGFTKEQRKALEAYNGPITKLPSAPALGAYRGIIDTPEEELTIPAGGPMLTGGKRRGRGQGRIRRYGAFIYWSD